MTEQTESGELEHAQQVYESVEHRLNTWDDLLDALRGFGGETGNGWHAIQCSGGHGETEPPPTQRCSKARNAIAAAERG